MQRRQMDPFVRRQYSRPKEENNIEAISFSNSQEKRKDAFPVKEFLTTLKKDDYILIGIIAVLIFEGCDDYILLAALGYLFVMGIKWDEFF